jgi:outer membrane autotransporter protein
VGGNLALASTANYIEAVSPTTASLTSVTGSAAVNGTFTGNLAPGTYTIGKRYTVLTAAGGVSGAFATTTVVSPSYVKPALSYDANNVYLTLAPASLVSNLGSGTYNQKAVLGAVDAAVAGGFVPAGGALALYGLSGTALNGAVDQISGQVNANVSNAVGASALSFLSMVLPDDGMAQRQYAPGQAYGGADAPSRALLGSGEARFWGAVYGGTADLDGNASNGAAGLSASNYGFAIGVDTRLDANLLAGLTVGVGHQDFSSGNGAGNSDDVMLGGYFRESLGNAYLAGSVAYGWHSIATSRTVTISGTDVLTARFDAHDIGGRIEAGWRLPLEDINLTPYGAWTRSSFDAPSYGESAASGASTFALSTAARTTAVGRTELGAKLGHDFGWGDDALTASLKLAWAHQLDDTPTIQAAFTGLPGGAFQVIGTHAGADSAIVGGALEAETKGGLHYGVKLESQLGQGTTIFQGMGELAWHW